MRRKGQERIVAERSQQHDDDGREEEDEEHADQDPEGSAHPAHRRLVRS